MIIKNVKIENFRNIEKARFSPHKKMNVIYGENAQGKTNIIEAIWLLTGNKSFRKAKDSEFTNFNKNFFKIFCRFENNEREQIIELNYKNEKEYFLNEIKMNSLTEINEKFNAVVFSPLDISLISDGPSIRRDFLDSAITKIYPAYDNILKNYIKAITQRNNTLKDYYYHEQLASVLDAFEETIAKLGFLIIKYRKRYIEILNEFAPLIYKEITQNKENLELEYCTNIGKTVEEFKNKLKKSRKEDMFNLKTSIGPHRDNLEIKIKGISARNYGSQGQKRTAALTIKLAEGEVINKVTNNRPIILLDDIMSELDPERQNYILNHIKNKQVFITCCDPKNIICLKKGKVFKVTNGKIVREKF